MFAAKDGIEQAAHAAMRALDIRVGENGKITRAQAAHAAALLAQHVRLAMLFAMLDLATARYAAITDEIYREPHENKKKWLLAKAQEVKAFEYALLERLGK